MKIPVLLVMLGLLFTSTNAQKYESSLLIELVSSKGKKSESRQNARAEKKRKVVIKKLVQELCDYLQTKGAKDKKRVAVISFLKPNNEISELGKFLAENISISLFRTEKFLVVDRSQISTLMDENKIGATGTLNPSEVARLGKLAGVQFVITGIVTMGDNQFNLSIKGINVERGSVAAVAEGSIPRTQGFDNLYNGVSKTY
jgi:TolB-like protein